MSGYQGHLGDVTVEHAAHHLPIIVQESLYKVISGPDVPMPTPEVVRDMLAKGITAFDDAIAGDVLELFPGGLASLPSRSDEEIQAVVNDFAGPSAGANYKKARLCLYGTTALVALVDPTHENLWVANLGDCEAGTSGHLVHPWLHFFSLYPPWPVPNKSRLTPPLSVLVTPDTDGRPPRHEVLNVLHNGTNPAEIARVRRDHPGEPDSVMNGRVLGTIAPFRCESPVPAAVSHTNS